MAISDIATTPFDGNARSARNGCAMPAAVAAPPVFEGALQAAASAEAPMGGVRLQDLVSVEILQKVQDNFSATVGVAMVIVDEHGVPLTRPSGFSEFCDVVRTCSARRERCYACDNRGGRKAMSIGEPSIYKCHCDLVDFAAPIILRGQYLGGVIAGQVRIADRETRLEYIVDPDPSWKEDETLRALAGQIRTISYSKLRSAAFTLCYIAGYLVEEGYRNAVSQELNAKNLKLLEEIQRRGELEQLLREAELRALVYQVDPHFLFNVLNTIGRLAMLEKAEKTEEMVYAFADMMRYVLKRSGSQFVLFQKELEHVCNYLHVQKVRLGGRLDVVIDVPQKYQSVMCPFMALHPIVENSVNYAVEPRADDGRIEVRARDDGRDMILEVIDNGEGIDPDRARAALAGTARHGKRTSIGIHNVDSRLKRHFGEEYGLKIESPFTPEGGTKVTIRVPLKLDPTRL